MTTTQTRRHITERLTPVVGAGEACAMADIIMADVVGVSPVDIAVNPNREITTESLDHINTIVSRVVEGEPLQYILGRETFHGLQLFVSPGVLIPRPETSQLVDIIVDNSAESCDLRVLDVCCGSGCIAVALGRALRFPVITAVDISDDALKVTEINAKALRVKVAVEKRDVLKNGLPEGTYDIIVSNPPYVDESESKFMDRRVLDYEPALALFVPDNDPLLFYRAIANDAISHLAPGGTLYFEINPRHADDLMAMLRGLGFCNLTKLRDFEGRYRFIIVRQ